MPYRYWNPYLSALVAAMLFGVATPIAKHALPGIHPFALSGLLYLGAGLAAALVISSTRLALVAARGPRSEEAALRRADALPILGTVLLGGVMGPCLLFFGLARTSALTASLLLNLEAVFTIAIACVTGERLTRRELLGCGLIILASGILTFDSSGDGATTLVGALAIAAACAAWGGDNNVVRALARRDPLEIVRLKGLAAAPVSFLLAVRTGADWPAAPTAAGALVLGAVSYGASVALFVHAVRGLGAARTGALFASAPFAGAFVSMLLGESISTGILIAGALMAGGVKLLGASTHFHEHIHAEQSHEHEHAHDEHHQHEHAAGHESAPHSHSHRHEYLVHAHPHSSDAHHLHEHG